MRPVPADLIVARVFIADRGVFPAVNSTDLERLACYDQDGDATYELVGGVKVHRFTELKKLYSEATLAKRQGGKLVTYLPTDNEVRAAMRAGKTVDDLYEAARLAYPEVFKGLKQDPDNKGRNRRFLDLLRALWRCFEEET